MARTSIGIVEVVSQESATLAFENADAVNGMMFLNDGTSLLIVQNNDAADKQVTIVSVPDEAGRVQNYVKPVMAGSTEVFGPYLPAWWNQTFTDVGNIYVNLDDDTDVKVKVIDYS